jgi:hypothetical protein
VQHDADKSQRVTVHEAAELLGITPEAVRARLYRGTLEREDGEDGTVYVRLHAAQLQPHADQSPDQSELVKSLQDQIGYLRAHLDTRTEELREHRRIIAALTQRIPELPPASSKSTRDAPQSPETATVEETEQRFGGAQEGAQRPWWRRVFRG